MKLFYSEQQIQSAAKFIWKKNEYVADWPTKPECPDDVYTLIKEQLFEYAREVSRRIKEGEDWGFFGRGGYWVLITVDDADSMSAEVLVDAAVSKKPFYSVQVLRENGDED